MNYNYYSKKLIQISRRIQVYKIDKYDVFLSFKTWFFTDTEDDFYQKLTSEYIILYLPNNS